jgi:hypothetical protein
MTRDREDRSVQSSVSELLVRLLVLLMVLFLVGVVLAVARSWRQLDLNSARLHTLARNQLEDEKLREEILRLERERGLSRSLVTNATILIGALGFVVTGLGYVNERRRERFERAKDRLTERNRLAALYVNPFLFACEDLQSRLYNILCNRGLGPLREQYPTGRHAVEVLYLIARYFAYEELLLRYSQYGIDKNVLRYIRQIREAFSTDKIKDKDWRIFRPQQNALGRFVQAGRKGEYGDEPDSISLWEFEKGFAAVALQDERLRQAHNSLRDLKGINNMHRNTYKRLARIQARLVALLNYLEAEESRARGAKFSLFNGERASAPEVKPASGCTRRG